MNEREIGELRRRLRPEKQNIDRLRGCYINEKREIISEFNQSLALMTESETEQLLALLKKCLSGSLHKNLTDLAFSTQQVVGSSEHRLLMRLRDSALQDDDAIQTFYQTVIQSLSLEGNYMILLAHDTYDVPYRSKDDLMQNDAASEVYSYILCSICPVKLTKTALSYDIPENAFHNLAADWVVAAPEVGFLFPTFDDRSTNLYNVLYYTRDIAENHSALADALFHCTLPMPAAAQKDTFQTILGSTLEEECNYQVVQTVHDQLCTIIEEHKSNKIPEPLTLSKSAVQSVLRSSGISNDKMDAFTREYDAEFGENAVLSPRNLVDLRQMEIKAPDVTIHINAARSDLVETKIIDGVPCIIIRAEGGVEVDGVPIQIS